MSNCHWVTRTWTPAARQGTDPRTDSRHPAAETAAAARIAQGVRQAMRLPRVLEKAGAVFSEKGR